METCHILHLYKDIYITSLQRSSKDFVLCLLDCLSFLCISLTKLVPLNACEIKLKFLALLKLVEKNAHEV